MAGYDLQIAPTVVNPLLGYIAQGADLRNQGATQDLSDRATLRGLAPGLASGDPDASATAATVAGGPQALAGLAAMHEDDRKQLANTLETTGRITAAILAAPADQRASLWQSYRPTMVQAGATTIPQEYPGDDYANSHRAAALDAGKLIELLGNVPTTDPTRTPLSLPLGPKVGPGGVILPGQAQQPGGMSQAAPNGAPSSYVDAVIGAESGGDPNAVNRTGSTATGLGQFTKETWLGLLPTVRPDLANLPLDQQLALRTDPAVSRQMVAGYAQQNAPLLAAAGVPVTPTTLSLAHGFGAAGATKLLQAAPDTSMEALYPPTVQNGQQVPNIVMAENPQYRGKSAGQVRQMFASRMANVSGGGPAPQQPVQTASLAGTTGMPATATDAAPDDDENAPATSPSAPRLLKRYPDGTSLWTNENGNAVVHLQGWTPPGVQPAASGVSPAVDGALARAAQPPPPAAAIPEPNALLSAATPSGGQGASAGRAASSQPPLNALLTAGAPPAPPQRNALMPPAPQPQQVAQAGAPPSQAGAGAPLYVGGKPWMSSKPGYVMTRRADGSYGEMQLPGAPIDADLKISGGKAYVFDKNTGQFVGQPMDVPDQSRTTSIPGPGGTHLIQSGQDKGVIPYSGRPEQADAYKADVKTAADIAANGQAAENSLPRLNEAADIAQGLATGPGKEWQAKALAYLEANLGPGAATDWARSITGLSSGAAAQEFVKLNLTAAGAASKQDVGSNAGVESVKLYQSANPGLGLLPDANKRVGNLMRVSAQAQRDYAQAALQEFGTNETQFLHGGDYKPLTTFNREWQAQNNPQTYSAAIGILNGDPFKKWSARVTPEQGQRAAQIAARIDPSAMVSGRNGGMIPASSFLSKAAP